MNIRNTEQLVEKVKLKFGDEYTVLGQYVKSGAKILMMHNKCGHKWNVYTHNLFSGKSKCPKCSNKLPLTTELFKEKVAEIDKEYVVVGEYVNTGTKVKIKHSICGYEWGIRPHHFTSTKVKCPRCQNREQYTTDDFAQLVDKTTDGEYKLKSEYMNNRSNVEVEHIECGTIFKIKPVALLYSDKRCPNCKVTMSKGEKRIFDILTIDNIDFTQQQTFEDCKDINVLRFDFSIKENEKIIALIEFDGGQHFFPVEFFGGEEGFINTQRRDNIKNEYCKTNRIPLLRIPYWDYDNIEEILSKFINKIIKRKVA